MKNDLIKLAQLIEERNDVDLRISRLIGRPSQIGHIGEYIAAHIFSIDLLQSATNKGFDGRFNKGPLVGRSVNIKCYAKKEGTLAMHADYWPDYYLVLTGPTSAAKSSKGTHRPITITQVFLFHGNGLLSERKRAGVQIGVATSVKARQWDDAEIYPRPNNPTLQLDDEERELLALFAPT